MREYYCCHRVQFRIEQDEIVALFYQHTPERMQLCPRALVVTQRPSPTPCPHTQNFSKSDFTRGEHIIKKMSAPSLQVCPRVCIFDIDNTLTTGADHDPAMCTVLPGPSPAWPESNSGATQDIKNAIKACYDKGYKIAFTSAESRSEGCNDKQKAFISSLDPSADGKLFNSAFFDSPAYQNSWNVLSHTQATDAKLEFGHKEAMFLGALQHYGVPPECFKSSIVFDDQAENITTAHGLGLRAVQASPECGGFYCTWGCGLTSNALRTIERLSH